MECSKSNPLNYDKLAAERGIDLNEELTTGFAARFIRRKAKQLVGRSRFTASDRPELEQDLRITLLERMPKFKPQVRHWHVFVTMVIESPRRHDPRVARARKCEHSQNILSLSTRVIGEDGEWTELGRTVGPEHLERVTGRVMLRDQDQTELEQDLESLLPQLPDDLRDLCARLKTDSLTRIAARFARTAEHTPRSHSEATRDPRSSGT